MRFSKLSNHYPVLLGIVIVTLTVYRLWIMVTSPYTLFADESYYFGWAQNLTTGYYSKPPMIAWLIALTTGVCGDGEACVKSGALLIYPLTTVVIFLLAKALYDDRIGFWSAVVFYTLPVVFVSSQIISTDVVLILFWSLAFYFFIRALQTNKDVFWVLAGVSAGLGLLSKYTMVIFLVSVLLYLALSSTHRHQFRRRGLYISMITAVVVFAPNILWNIQHGFATVVHTGEISRLDQGLFHPENLLKFFSGQMLVFGVILFVCFMLALAGLKKRETDDRMRMLALFSVPFLAVISLQALLARAHLNWAAPTYVAASVMVVAYLFNRHRQAWLYAGLILNLILGLAIYHFDSLATAMGVELSVLNDPYKRVRGWDKLGLEVQKVYEKYPGVPLLADDRKSLAQLIYYLRPHPYGAMMWNPRGARRSQYDLETDMSKKIGDDFIYITFYDSAGSVARHFQSHRLLASISVPIHKDFKLKYNVYYMERFKGY
ncbi:MAG: glycosyltransferase family 39 protein [Gammaproteobacteria bacterium]|nr:glycosyltransferase family 39 protein [Gammaproteobacteria bacterium]